MITIAVLGVIASIAIPTYQGYVRQATQTEAKSTLMGIFAAERNFYSQWGVYVGALPVAGYVPEGKYFYIAGFDESLKGFCGHSDAVSANSNLGCGMRPKTKFTGPIPLTNADGSPDTAGANKECTNTWMCENALSSDPKCKAAVCTYAGASISGALKKKATYAEASGAGHTFMGADSFKAAAAGCLQGSCEGWSRADKDAWSINHNKNLVHVENGLD